MITLLVHSLFRLLPPLLRESIKSLFSASGHRKSVLDKLRAISHAAGKKRIDKVTKRVIDEIEVANLSNFLSQKRCMEFGAGYMPSELIVYLALGANEVVAVDLNPIARLNYLEKSISNAPKDWLKKLGKLDVDINLNLESINRFNLNDVVSSGRLSYVAPFDMSEKNFESEPFDFIHSVSVLEHLPTLLVRKIVDNLCKSLSQGGVMIHNIDLTDHRDAEHNPFDFLRSNTTYKPLVDYDTRGNRLRLHEWMDIFSGIQGFTTSCIASKSLPLGFSVMDLGVDFKNLPMVELCRSEITLMTTRNK